MIGSARFQNFKALKDVEITFDSRLTVLVGPNGSGKSSVLKGLDLLCQMTRVQGQRHDLGILSNHVNGYFGGGEGNIILELGESGKNAKAIRFETHPNNVHESSKKISPLNYKFAWLRTEGVWVDWDSSSVKNTGLMLEEYPSELITFRAIELSHPTTTRSNPPDFGSSGEGLASLMAYFKLFDEPKFDLIEELFCKLISQVKRIRINKVPIDGGDIYGEALLFDLAARKGVPASAMSDGTLYALGLIVKILDPQRPRVLLIDDIEHGFHPKAQLQIVEMLHKLLEEIPELQIIATTHSPFILDRLNWNEVRVTGLTDDGAVVIKKIEDHPQIDQWKNEMSPGEFWATFYESWVTQLQPTPLPV